MKGSRNSNSEAGAIAWISGFSESPGSESAHFCNRGSQNGTFAWKRAPPAVCSLHADYLCRHAGACCTAGWAIPVEEATYDAIAPSSVHFGARGRRRPERLFATDGPLPEGAAPCSAWRRAARVCSSSRIAATSAPSTASSGPNGCRWLAGSFPVFLHDARGTFISLSHFCPTAAGLLQSGRRPAFEIVAAPSTLALDGDAEGLDARDALPPLLRPGMLTDHEGYDAWERRAIGVTRA